MSGENELAAVRAAIWVGAAVLGALVLVAAALPGRWALLVVPSLVAVPLLAVEAYLSVRRGGGAR
ncbi:hypothetical protein AGRA3207_007879 (plasmid) [Actinomadura graeca]|uniref:Secreted protein n=1 Tax=Actinomadura graeca TaxID=2750812 RepID=A0ABX8R7L7_9ACTN|nr:hypothetical protein [Actinomadura graeca]QXJ27081.1 hypothetical protein AGRA3207_007879 [Actinomadura graeca]